ncbi:hypothetical protein B0T16DRAFT_417102 [Cercophora newfieldiana]|uniref:Uncharacterized protein n=1 Tax=Cercophora newfieldiana TaxID=92897 RepID=A0AA40CMP6_9PEZI|nr:hypothetical protein B0T16DRAFT_417102 [Cercophora newfieldiana]
MMCLWFACHGRNDMKELADKDNVEWSLAHAFLANMGGFAIDFRNTPSPNNLEQKPPGSGAETEPPLETSINNLPSSEGKESPIDEDDAISPHASLPSAPAPPAQVFSAQTVGDLEKQAPTRHDTTYILRSKLSEWLKKHSSNRWFIFPVPKVVQGRWEEHTKNKQLVQDSLAVATPESLGFHTPRSYFESMMALQGNIWIIDGIQLQYARKNGLISRLPDFTESQIMDRSKGDWVTKSLAILQVTWLWVQLAMRYAQHLPATQLEIMTAAFATCSFITYVMYFYKPKDVATREYLPATTFPTVSQIAEIGKLGPTAVWFSRVHLIISNDCYHHLEDSDKDTAPWLILACGTVGMLFGSVHFACWNSHFPTPGERLGWIISCGLLVGLPIPICLLMVLDHRLDRKRRNKKERTIEAGHVIKTVVFALEVVYVLARFFIMAEAGRSLWYLTSGSFVATSWTFNVPHV